MDIRVDQRAHVTVIAVAGSVDSATAPALVAAFRENVAGGRIRIVGDFAGVDYTSSAGLRALLETVKEARQRGDEIARIADVHRNTLARAPASPKVQARLGEVMRVLTEAADLLGNDLGKAVV